MFWSVFRSLHSNINVQGCVYVCPYLSSWWELCNLYFNAVRLLGN